MDEAQARWILEESPYWLEILKILEEQNTEIGSVAERIADAVISLMALVSLTDEETNVLVGTGLEATNEALTLLHEVQKSMLAARRITEGRNKAMRAAIAEEDRDE
jgi:predicted amino acid-binding ACT domain protein